MKNENIISPDHPHGKPDPRWITDDGRCLLCADSYHKSVIAKLEARADECRKLLGYDDGDLLDNVTRYKQYAESEIALRDVKAKMGIAYIEKLQAALRGFLGDGEIELEIKYAREVLAEASGLNS